MKKEIKYKFDRFGYAQLLLDVKNNKLGKISSVTSIAVIIILFSIGILSKEIFIVMLANTGINKVTGWLVG